MKRIKETYAIELFVKNIIQKIVWLFNFSFTVSNFEKIAFFFKI